MASVEYMGCGRAGEAADGASLGTADQRGALPLETGLGWRSASLRVCVFEHLCGALRTYNPRSSVGNAPESREPQLTKSFPRLWVLVPQGSTCAVGRRRAFTDKVHRCQVHKGEYSPALL